MAETPPYGSYAGIMGTFVGALAVTGWLARRHERDPQCHTALDLAVLGAATFKAARTISQEQAIGELVTCTRCAGTWAAAGLTWTQVLAPRFGRILTWTLAAGGLNDFLQAASAALTQEPEK